MCRFDDTLRHSARRVSVIMKMPLLALLIIPILGIKPEVGMLIASLLENQVAEMWPSKKSKPSRTSSAAVDSTKLGETLIAHSVRQSKVSEHGFPG